MNQYEINQIKSKLRQIGQDEAFINKYVDKLLIDCENFRTACKKINKWEKINTNQFILQILTFAAASALFGGWLATIN